MAGCSWSKGWYRKAAALESLGRLAEAETAAREGTDLGSSKELVAQHVRLCRLSLQNAIRALFVEYDYRSAPFLLESQGGVYLQKSLTL